MCVFKNHAFIYFLRPPEQLVKIPVLGRFHYVWQLCMLDGSCHLVVYAPYISQVITPNST
jgi:hypothetical protein